VGVWVCGCAVGGRGIHYWADKRSHTHTNTNTDTHQNKNVNSCFCMSSAAKIICIFIFLYCPRGKIKKSERNDGKTNSELLEAGAFVHACIEFQMQRHTCAKYVHRPNNLNV